MNEFERFQRFLACPNRRRPLGELSHWAKHITLRPAQEVVARAFFENLPIASGRTTLLVLLQVFCDGDTGK
jgi:hypothetical protein